MAKKSNLGILHKNILKVLTKNPSGIDIHGIRSELKLLGQQHLDRRVRQLDPFYIIDRKREGRKTLYLLRGPRPEGEWDFEKISKTLRAKILARDGSRCQMCGRTVSEDKIKLHVDHKVPQEWGGKTFEDNLWSLCSTCNEGKKNYFKTFDDALMKKIMNKKSVHERIAYLLKEKRGEWVDSDLIEFVANYLDYQTDWRKRLRELRYLGLEIKSSRRKIGKRTISLYKLVNWVHLPSDPSRAARQYEKKRALKNNQKQK